LNIYSINKVLLFQAGHNLPFSAFKTGCKLKQIEIVINAIANELFSA
jgi:hypothetical protein